ncbi:MAG: hypothetical protein HUU35_03285, partial [Armatimonadetes bacterium]|nr:hypothetical protein [Armatimonadota bacterium]
MSRPSEADTVRVLLSRILVQAGRVDEAGALVDEVRGRPTRGSSLAGLLRAEAMVRRARGDIAGAVQSYHESLGAQDHSQPSRDLASTYLEAGLAHRDLNDAEGAREHLRAAVDTAGMLGSRDLWQQAVDELWQLDIMEAQRLMLKPYLPGSAVEELRGGEAAGRLQVATVMFVDMRGATALSGTLTPLELAEVVSAFLGPVVSIILRWGGTVDKFIGDCVMAVFGLGSSDGAEEATRAGLEIIEYMEATKEIRRRSGASVLEATIGVNTGEVVAGCFGPLLRRDYTVLGYHVNLAQRLQSVAGSVKHDRGTRMVISEATRHGLRTPLPLSPIDLRTLTLKGIDTSDLSAWLVLADEALGGTA